MITQPKDILQKYWSYSEFRTFQEEIIDCIIQKQDTIALLPTGGGKSICYQVPALLQEGLCIVVSPLLALIKDQIENLAQRNIKAVYISSDQNYWEQEDIFTQIETENISLLYVSPERLSSTSFIERICNYHISFLAIDEAHCISEWGNDFRPSYQKINAFRQTIGNVPILALTATATENVLIDVINRLGLQNTQVFKNTFKRDNISIQIIPTSNKISEIEIILKSISGSKIIYTRTRNEAETLNNILKKKNYDIDFFHAGMSKEQKNKKQLAWMQSSSKTLIATNAFGMGIDKENVSTIIHYSPSYSLENYYQEIGRAGRNGDNSFAFLLYETKDLEDMKSIVTQAIPNKKEYKNIITLLYSTFQIAEGELSEESFPFDFQKFNQRATISKRKIQATLTYLHNIGCIFWNQKQELSKIKIHISPKHIDDFTDKYQYILEGFARKLNGVFTQETVFSKAEFAQNFHLKTEDFSVILEEWHRKEYITFRDGNKDTITFLWHRKDNYLFSFWKEFEKYLQNKYLKFIELEYYVTNTSYCKMRLILGYFGEKTKVNCGKCSYCMQQKKQKEPLQNRIIKLITQPTTLDDILHNFAYEEKEKVLEAIQHLISEEYIKPIKYNLYDTCNKN